MQEVQPRDQERPARYDGAGVSLFASQVVSLLADRSAKAADEFREPLLTNLIAASLSGKENAFRDLLGELRRSRVSLAALADIYIPEAARRMGAAWHDDRMSWADVSIGVARMQSLLREIGVAWNADQAGDTDSGTILLMVPEAEQHTLGAMVAMGQMRRYGVSVCLRIAPTRVDLALLLEQRRFDGIFISVATKDKLEPLAETVRFIRGSVRKPCPIVVGGAVMFKVEDPAARIGADFSSNDIGRALEAIGLKFDASSVLRRA